MTAVPPSLPPAIACPSCGTSIREIPVLGGRPLRVSASPTSTGTVWVHDTNGPVYALGLGTDAAKAYRSARVPLHSRHERCAP